MTRKIDELIRSDRRTISLTVQDGRLVVHAPKRAPMSVILRFVTEKAEWIEKREAEYRAALAACPAHAYWDGERFLYWGEACTLRRDPAISKIRCADGWLTIPDWAASDCPEKLERWYRARAKEAFSGEAQTLSAMLGVPCPHISLSSAKTRWGSCSAKNSVCLAWRLVMAPPEVLRYVVLHELCHIKEKNHQADFWALVASVDPEWKQKRQWLREHGRTLYL